MMSPRSRFPRAGKTTSLPVQRTVRKIVRKIVRMVVSGAALAMFLALVHSEARAESERLRCSFLEIQASNNGEGIDPELRPLSRKLTRPPLSSWKSFKLIARHDKDLVRMTPQEVQLKLGGKLSALYREHTKPKDRKDRFSLGLTLDNKSGKRSLDTKIVVDSGDYFVIAHSSSQDSSELLAITCKLP
jgi:hypothetical protein